MSLQERLLFLKNYRENFHRTGSITQSSAFLSRAITSRIVGRDEKPLRILEAGIGTGAFTRAIAQKLRPQDRLFAYEINDEFVTWIRQQFATDPALAAVRDRIEIVHAPIQSVTRAPTFDFIVCSLPFNNFPPELVREVFDVFREVAQPNATVSFFEYAAIRPVRKVVSKSSDRQRLRAVGEILKDILHDYRDDTELVLLNFPPAYVHHLRFGSSN